MKYENFRKAHQIYGLFIEKFYVESSFSGLLGLWESGPNGMVLRVLFYQITKFRSNLHINDTSMG